MLCHCISLWTWRVRFARASSNVASYDQARNVSIMLQDALMQRAIAKLAKVRQQRETWKQRAMQLKVICANMQTSLHTMTQLAQAAMPEGRRRAPGRHAGRERARRQRQHCCVPGVHRWPRLLVTPL